MSSFRPILVTSRPARTSLSVIALVLLLVAVVAPSMAAPRTAAPTATSSDGTTKTSAPGRSGAAPGRVKEPPAEEPPAEEPPAEDPPAEDPPAEDPPAEEPPAEDPPAEDPPAEEPPAEDPPAEDLAAEDPPAEDPGVLPAYSALSPWNSPIPKDAPIHPDSRTFVASFEAAASTGVTRRLTSDPSQYTYPLYRIDTRTPTRTIALSGNFSHVVDETTTRTSSAPTLQVPIPLDAQPSPGSDASVVLWDPVTGEEWGFWQFQNHGDGTFSARNGYRYDTRWSGVPPTSPNRFGSRGAGVPYLAGLVRRDEIDAGRIDHALAFAYDYPTAEFVWPATKSDGTGVPGRDVPEGARIRLDPTLTEADFDAWGLSREGRIIARALQRYGMYTVDQAGRPKVMIEDERTARWDGTITAATVSGIPWDAFEVLDWRAPKPPMPVLPAGTTVAPGALVTLRGDASYDPDGGPISVYEWAAPAGVALAGATSATPAWDTAGLAPGDYTFSLRVRDSSGTWSLGAASITFTVAEPTAPTILQQQAFGGTYTDAAVSDPWRPLGDEDLLTIVALRPARTTVDTVTGNGLAWHRVLRHQDTQGELAVEVWRASGPSPVAGPVEVTTATGAWAMNVQSVRVTPSTVVHVAGADTGAIDTASPSVTVRSPAGPSLSLGVHVGRATPFTPDAGLVEVARHAVGEGGNNVRTTLLSAVHTTEGDRTLGGRQNSPLDWVMGGLVLR